jgi:hypothetical protein
MKPLAEKLLLENATINKVKYDKEWFYCLSDIKAYLNEDISNIEYIHLPMIIEEEQEFVKCATYEDILRGRK